MRGAPEKGRAGGGVDDDETGGVAPAAGVEGKDRRGRAAAAGEGVGGAGAGAGAGVAEDETAAAGGKTLDSWGTVRHVREQLHHASRALTFEAPFPGLVARAAGVCAER